MTLTSILVQAAAGGSSAMGSFGMLAPMLLIFVIFYFFMIRPQNKKQKEIQKARAALKQGDTVVTSGGIYGKIKDVRDDSFLIEIADNVRIKVEKASVFAAGTKEASAEQK